ncbi:MAG: AAA family ATPase [Flavobacteriales bacterium]|nr:AAA family ATPase [Flavobacteriales bacterium]MBP9139731.1 AAA family ATPase [Flavobacteriales bacterium]
MATMAARFVNSTSRHVFLTGKAGTGKTTFLHRLAQSTHKRYVILAPTGIAALNAKGVTIHSQFLLPFGTYIPERNLPADIPAYGNFHDRDTLTKRHPLNAIRRNVLRSIDLLIIDEVSMLRADLLDAIDHRMRSVRGVYDRSFGGVQVLLIGDLHQLPPVVKDTEWSILRKYYANAHFFESRVIKEAGYAHIELDKIFRQQDGEFIDILNNLRNNTVTAKDVETLNAHYKANIPKSEQDGVITLTTHNRIADELNNEALAALPGKSHVFSADVEGKFPESMFPVLTELELKVGAQIMFIRNDTEKVYFNGKLAKVTDITEEGIEVEMLDNGLSYTLKKEVWENRRYVVNARSKQQEEEIEGTFEQYPVKLAWAITVHKSQGLTFDKAIIDVGNAFAPGQVYVALSRLRSLKGLTLRTRIDPSVVSTDRDVMAFSERQHTQQPLSQQLKEQQRHYLQAVLISTFDLGDIMVKVGFVQKDHSDVDEFEDASMKTALARFKLKLETEVQNTRTFQNQLVRLLHSDDHEALLGRIEKGGAYYSAILKESIKDLLQHLAQVEMVSRSKGYADDLREIDTLLAKKLQMIVKVGYITTCILNGESIQRKPELQQDLADQRTSLVNEIAEWAESNKPTTSNKTGRKRVRKSAEGVFAKKGSRSKVLKGGTYKASYALFKAGKSIAEVAAERKLTESTIEGHAAKGIAAGEVEIGAVLDDATRNVIATYINANPEHASSEIFNHFGGKHGYGKLKMVQAWLHLDKGDA